MTPTPSPDPGRCPECGCGWWEPHRTGCSEPRFLTPDPAAAGEGTERPDTAALLTIGDWLLRTLPGHQGAEQTAAALAYTVRWIDAQPPVPPTPTPCPYIVTGGEGTSHCSLAERSAMHAAVPPTPTPQADGTGQALKSMAIELAVERRRASLATVALLNACRDGWADGDSAAAKYLAEAELAAAPPSTPADPHPTDPTGSEA